MPSNKEYLARVLDLLSDLPDVTCRAMMGEYILYVDEKIVGGIYDNRLLVKPTKAAEKLLPDAPFEEPYGGAKPMLLVEKTDDRAFLCALFEQTAAALPAPKARKKS